VPLSIDVIENKRERAVVRVNDSLITQEIDVNYSSLGVSKGTLRIEDLSRGGQAQEIKFSVVYESGRYQTTLYENGQAPKTYTTAFDPLEPGVLRASLQEQPTLQGLLSAQTALTRFWWDGIRMVHGSNRDINYSRPCVVHHGFCSFTTRSISGTRLGHLQLSITRTNQLMGLSATMIGAAIGAIIKPGIVGAVAGGLIGLALQGFVTEELRRLLVDERGTMWINHRIVALPLPLPPHAVLVPPTFIRAGGLMILDLCPNTSPPPYRP